MAREYKQSTTFGDYYDHARDSITNAFLFYELCCIPTFSYLNASLILVVLGLTMTSFGYQEHIYNKECDINDNQSDTSCCEPEVPVLIEYAGSAARMNERLVYVE